jgi:AICAR transformylase/IMP cyclohydrolase PurH
MFKNSWKELSYNNLLDDAAVNLIAEFKMTAQLLPF